MPWWEQEERTNILGITHKIWVERRLRMPRIPDDSLTCAIYLYPSEEKAQKGESVGASGFLLHVRADTPENLVPVPPFPESIEPEDITPLSRRWFCYAVTNRHVVGEAPVVRMNTLDGKVDIVGLTTDDWQCHKEHDVAVAMIDLRVGFHDSLLVDLGMVLTKEESRVVDVGIGDDVNMIGRFINRDGRQTNRPTVRFGNISMMPGMPLTVDEDPNPQEAYLIETRTIPGYSGSPVFLEVPKWELLASNHPGSRRHEIGADNRNLVRLLGIAGGWIHGKREKIRAGRATVPGWRVDTNTGMMWCLPSWALLDLLNRDDLVEQRDELRRKWEGEPVAGAPA